ncbi:MAG: hypothetical protein WDO73_27420 [Ignavibacteriota bacterium]
MARFSHRKSRPPTFLWRDASSGATSWTIDVAFTDGAPGIHAKSAGEGLRIGEIDPDAVSVNNEPPKLTPEQAAAHTWTPDAATWAAIKTRSVAAPATVTITGFHGDDVQRPLSSGHVQIATSKEPAGAPVFYRDVPLMPNQGNKGVISPLAPEAIGLIKWRLRYLDEPGSRVVMQKISTCANCHSFSADGKTLGLDVDGPRNDHGLYALIPVAKETAIRTKDIIKWPTVRDPAIPRLRAAFMSQVSPDGRYVLSTIDDRDAAQRLGGRTWKTNTTSLIFSTTASSRSSIPRAARSLGTIADQSPGAFAGRRRCALRAGRGRVESRRQVHRLHAGGGQNALSCGHSAGPLCQWTPTRPKCNTTCTGFRSMVERAGKRNASAAHRRTE